MKIIKYLFAFLIIFPAAFFSCKNNPEEEIIIFHAGSLSVPLKQIATEYMEQNPGIDIKMEGAGSVACARKITELAKPCDIFASADYKVIEQFLIPEYTDWNIWFATNEMVIAYHEKSAFSDRINSENWFNILADEDVIYGRADPDADPCGYRTLMMFKLAEQYYGEEGLSDILAGKDMNMIRPKGVDLVALLETKALDYIIEYKSVCEQHNLSYISLPDEVNLSDPGLDELYKSVSVSITGDSPGDIIQIPGSSMIYGVTLLNNAPNEKYAVDFLRFFLNDRSMEILRRNGQSPVSIYLSGPAENIPEGIKELF